VALLKKKTTRKNKEKKQIKYGGVNNTYRSGFSFQMAKEAKLLKERI